MKKKILFLSGFIVFINCCSKETFTPSFPEIQLNKINAGSYTTTEWHHIIGGPADIEFTNNSWSIRDSLDLGKIGIYKTRLEAGIYDVRLSSRNNNSIADTFLRFTALKTGVAIQSNQTLNLDATTNDGLITINKYFVSDETVPKFTPANSQVQFKFAFLKGVFYLYVKTGVTGTVSFRENGPDSEVLKNITIEGSNQYDLVIVEKRATSVVHKSTGAI